MVPWFLEEIEKRAGSFRPLARFLYTWLFGDIGALFEKAFQSSGPLFPTLLESLGVQFECAPRELQSIPRETSAIFVSNHRYGFLEPAILSAILCERRAQVRFLGHYLAALVPQFREFVIPIDPTPGPRARAMNRRSLKLCTQHLNSGGVLVMFPAGRRAYFDIFRWKITERPWRRTAAWLAHRTGAPVIPVFFHGRNSWKFYVASTIHPLLGGALSGREMMNQRGRTIRVSFGSPLDLKELIEAKGVQAASDRLRALTLALAERAPAARPATQSGAMKGLGHR
jgi:putative hemolysin